MAKAGSLAAERPSSTRGLDGAETAPVSLRGNSLPPKGLCDAKVAYGHHTRSNRPYRLEPGAHARNGGHKVVAILHDAEKMEAVRMENVEPVVLDGLDGERLHPLFRKGRRA